MPNSPTPPPAAPAAPLSGELLLCPFCGSDDVRVSPANASATYFWGKCDACFATGRWEDTIEKAIAAWNRRAHSATHPRDNAPCVSETAKADTQRTASAQPNVCANCLGVGMVPFSEVPGRDWDVVCSACAGSDEHPRAQAQPAQVGSLPATLVPVADEWYRLCERRFHADRFSISGRLATAIVKTVSAASAPPHPPMPPERAAAERDAQHHAYLADEIVLQVCELPDRTSPADEPELLTVTREELRAIVLAALSAQQGGA